eukprot:CAMPEP_0177684386 /NCGR_PEP_ID=MMETSP0447-20121125/32412_1 /TAXON_ID=0 /ORGANISM="Stygamoeba regulata, Strain BSH-02190019" /LENGTH=103 /DNA_ID=CAMNT_0019194247 /DNA_START=33 /DNA_END=340 /DNA_ORIENTATION=+
MELQSLCGKDWYKEDRFEEAESFIEIGAARSVPAVVASLGLQRGTPEDDRRLQATFSDSGRAVAARVRGDAFEREEALEIQALWKALEEDIKAGKDFLVDEPA